MTSGPRPGDAVPPHSAYARGADPELAPLGRTLEPVLAALQQWGAANMGLFKPAASASAS